MHNFIEKIFDDDAKKTFVKIRRPSEFELSNVLKYQKCTKCNLELFDIKNNDTDEMMYEIFVLYDEEVYDFYGELSEIDLTCEEMIIKNIIE